MSTTRRSFLKSGAMSVLLTSGVLNGALVFAQRNRGNNDPSQDFRVPFKAQQNALYYHRRDTFQPYVGGVFTAHAGTRAVTMTLTNVRDYTPNPQSRITTKSRPSDSFALEFRASGKLTELTTIYDIEHAALGTFPLFMTRREDANGTIHYEAVYNHAR